MNVKGDWMTADECKKRPNDFGAIDFQIRVVCKGGYYDTLFEQI